MKNKFEEFYFENDKNYPVDVHWDLYDKNHLEALESMRDICFVRFVNWHHLQLPIR